jgi:hypothetical protein
MALSKIGGNQIDTVSGDLTVDTNTLKVDATNNRVFVGATSGDRKFEVHDTGVVVANFKSTGANSLMAFDNSSDTSQNHMIGFSGDDFRVVETTEKIRVLSSGGITFNGDTATANALDDYEEGNFTPTYVGFSISSVSANTGRYTKIGNTVMVQVDLQAVDWTSGTGHLGISNLPFAAGAQRAFTGTFAWYFLVNNLGTSDSLAGYVAGGSSSMMMYASQSGHIWHTIVTPSSGSNGYFNGTFWYRT